MRFRLVQELAADGVHVAVACRVLRVSTSGYFEWRGRPPSARAVADAELSAQIIEIHAMSRGTYGAPRIFKEPYRPTSHNYDVDCPCSGGGTGCCEDFGKTGQPISVGPER